MGATSFDVYYEFARHGGAPVTMQAAYDELVRDAYHESGSNGYNGTISTTGGLGRSRFPAMSLDAARLNAYDDCEHTQKWESAYGIEVLDPDCVTVRSTSIWVAMDTDQPTYDSVTVTNERDKYEALEKARAAYFAEVIRRAKEKVTAKAGETCTYVGTGYPTGVYESKPVISKPETTAKTVYRLEKARGNFGWNAVTEFPTLTEAKKAAKAFTAKDPHNPVQIVAVKGVVAVVSAEITRVKWEVKFVFEKPTKAPRKTAGYLFYGTAAI